MQSEPSQHTVIEAADMGWPTNAVLNLTPHDVFVLCDNDSTMAAFRAESGGPLRLSSSPQKPWGSLPSGTKDANSHKVSIPLCMAPRQYLDPKDFPFSRDDPAHLPIIVAGIVAPHIPRWYSGMVLVPDTGPQSAIRDDKGLITGVRRLYVVESVERNS